MAALLYAGRARPLLARAPLSLGLTRTYAQAKKKKTAAMQTPAGWDEWSEEERILKAQEFTARGGAPTMYTPLNQKLPLFDITVPVSSRPTGITGAWSWIKQSITERFSNLIHAYYLVKLIDLPDHARRPSRFSPALLFTQSTRRKNWVAPLRAHGLSLYTQYLAAQAAGDLKTIKAIARDDMAQQALQRLKARGPGRLVWDFHGEASPTKCISIRCLPESGLNVPRGEGAAAQALIRFETYQSLAVYDKWGTLVRGGTGEKNRVTDYIVFERKMWDPSGWYMKAQLQPPTTP